MRSFNKLLLAKFREVYKNANTTHKVGKYRNSVTKDIPDLLQQIVFKDYIIKGSVGYINPAEIPWVVIMNPTITQSAKEGYYVSFLFHKNLDMFYLSLDAGAVQFDRKYMSKDEQRNARGNCAKWIQQNVQVENGFEWTLRDLGATTELGQSYEWGRFYNKAYDLTTSQEYDLVGDIKYLLSKYDELVRSQKEAPTNERRWELLN